MEALRDWLFALEPKPAPRSQADPAVKRGAGLFASADLACATCHSGPKLTDNSSQDVGTGRPGELFQVPSLRAIAYRAPFMHNGCAQSLKQRFDKACGGGDKHGRTSRLSPAQLDDLVAYLESL
ncbi:MAG: c-type cytochrome, partial [Proteobacteria bacterium]|nr:c-type cytochrome [Pseudomonadota bacterium]